MFQIVTGGSGSGKSAFAEALAMELGKKTVLYCDDVSFSGKNLSKKLQDNRAMRAEKQFETIECYTNLKAVRLPSESIDGKHSEGHWDTGEDYRNV